jgi:hypothetical protein
MVYYSQEKKDDLTAGMRAKQNVSTSKLQEPSKLLGKRKLPFDQKGKAEFSIHHFVHQNFWFQIKS